MNDLHTLCMDPGHRTRWAGVLTWLGGRGRGRWATWRGRWIQTALTIGLLLTGVSAWALALVQPWAGRTGDPGIITLAVGVNAAQVRSADVGPEQLVNDNGAAPPAPLRRNPFVPVQTGPAAAGDAKGQVPPTSPATPRAAGQVLETVKGLRLEVILITPAGERWAVINAKNYREGDAVAGMEIVEIQEGRVKLQQGDITCLLRMD